MKFGNKHVNLGLFMQGRRSGYGKRRTNISHSSIAVPISSKFYDPNTEKQFPHRTNLKLLATPLFVW